MRNRFPHIALTLVIALALCWNASFAQTIQAGIFATGATLEVKAKPSANITTGALSNVVVTIKYPTSYGITFGAVTSGTMTTGQSFGFVADPGYTSGSDSYLTVVCVPGAGSITWTSGSEYLLFSVAVTGGTGTGSFSIVNDAATAGANGDCYFEVGGVDKTAGSPFYAASVAAVPLPVQMTNVAAAVNFRSTELSWSTETETNNYGFEIERREIGNSASVWTKVGFVQGAGTSTARRDYSFTDASLAPGRYAYQVKQVDIDGTFQYSGSLEVEVGVADKVLALADNFPNPFNPSTSIEFAVPADGKVMLKVFNVLGQEVATLFDGVAEAGRFHQARFDASSLPTGLYFSRLEYDGKSIMKKMLLTK